MASTSPKATLFQSLGLAGQSPRAGRPDEPIDWKAPTSILLETSQKKVEELRRHVPIMRVLDLDIQRVLGRGSAAGVPGSEEDEAKVRRSAIALAEVLQIVHPALTQLGPLARTGNYLEDVADPIVTKVNAARRDYTHAAFAAWGRGLWKGENKPWEVPRLLEAADRTAAEIPDYIVQRYLASPAGVFQQILPLARFRADVIQLRQLNNRPVPPIPGRFKADQMAGILRPQNDLLHDELMWRLNQVRGSHFPGRQATADELRELMFDIQIALVTASTLALWEQYIYFEKLLDDSIIDWLNDPKLGKAKAHRELLDAALTELEQYMNQTLTPAQRRAKVTAAAKSVSGLLGSPQFKETHQEILDRLDTIATVDRVLATLAIAAAATLAAAVAGAFAGALLFGAFEGVTVGSLVVARGVSWLGSLVVETLVFQYVFEEGVEFVYGPDTARAAASSGFLLDLTTGAVMRLSAAGYARLFKALIADPKGLRTVLGKVGFQSGRIGSAMLTTHVFTEAHTLVTQNRLMTDEERYRAVLTNVLTSLGLEISGFITKPLTDRLPEVAEMVRQHSEERYQQLVQDQSKLVPLHERVRTNQAKPEEVVAFLKALEALWQKEVQLIDDAYAGDASIGKRIKLHREKIEDIQFKLALMGVDSTINARAPSFRRLGPGVVAAEPAALPAVDRYVTERGGTKKPSAEILEAHEVTLKTSQKVWVVEGLGPDKVPPPERVAGAELEALRATVPGDSADAATKGLDKLKQIFNYARSPRATDEIVASIDPANLDPVLTLFAHDAIVGNLGGEFFRGINDHMDAVDFGRAYGAATLARIFRAYAIGKKWGPEVDAAIQKARGRILRETTEAGRKGVITKLQAAATDAEIKVILGDAKPKKAREPTVTVTDQQLTIDTASEEFVSKYVPEAAADALAHGQTLTPAELEARASLAVIKRAAELRRFRRYSWKRRIAIIDRFDQLARLSKLPNGPMVAKRGSVSEWLFNPQMGKPKPVFLGGFRRTGAVSVGATIPDFHIRHPDHIEWFNQKSDVRAVGTKTQAEAMAREYLDDAVKREHPNIPAGDTYSIHFVRVPPKDIQDAIVAILKSPGSPISRVVFGPLPDSPVLLLPATTVITIPLDGFIPVPEPVPVP